MENEEGKLQSSFPTEINESFAKGSKKRKLQKNSVAIGENVLVIKGKY